MAYDEEIADRLRLLLSGRGLTEKKMFGGLAFLLGGNPSENAPACRGRPGRPGKR